jgi:ABC-type Fe3+-hydroxamate transport system substrate-binding protein
MRIVSLVPSFTELLFDLGLGSNVVGITRFCIHPANKLKNITKIGGTKSIKIERIISLNPDLVLANKEENSQAEIEALSKHCPVWLTEIYSLQDSLDVILMLGEKADVQIKAQKMVTNIQNAFTHLRTQISSSTKTVAYLIWENPIMLAGRNTFINAVLNELHWINSIADESSRYPEITENDLEKSHPDLILLSSEPYPFTEKHQKEYSQKYPNSKVVLIDGEMFSWYGSRLKLAPQYFEQLVNEVEII